MTAAQSTDLAKLEADLRRDIDAAGDLAALEAVRVAAVGKKGRISDLMSQLGQIKDAEARKAFGAAVNQVKGRVGEALEARKARLGEAALAAKLAAEQVDITLPVRIGPQGEGRIHPVSQVMDEIAEIFGAMGFAVAEGPDIETDDLNFTKLNIPAEHPARQEHDTFYLKEGAGRAGDALSAPRMLLRTHTSPVQIRTMLRQKPPIRIIAPGRVYRCDSDQTHTPMFHQIEGLVIDESTHMGHLKWCLEEFARAFFEVDEVTMRFRASHFPFTEPSAEVDIGYTRVGNEIRIGGGAGKAGGNASNWLEILGCGMVHPKVLRNCGLDPDKYQGWAFGMGIDRIAMLKYGMPDLRAFFAADLRWLKHYGFLPFDVPTLAGGMSGP